MIVNIQEEGCFRGMTFTIGRLVGVKYTVGIKVICETGLHNAFYYF